MSEKEKAFELFDEGYRPSEIYDEIKVKPRVLYNYYQEWKKKEEGIRLEAKEEERDIELELEAEEEQNRLDELQREAEERARRQQQETQRLADELHGIEITLNEYQWYPDHLVDWWSRPEVNKVYSSPEEYRRALERRRDYLRSIIKERTRV